MERSRISELTSAWAEAFAALGGAVALTLAMTAALTAVVFFVQPGAGLRAEVPLQRAGLSLETSQTPEELVKRLEETGVARQVQVVNRGEAVHLVLEGVRSRDSTVSEVQQALGAGGYRLAAIEFLPLSDPMALMKNMVIVVPALAIQAFVFILIGAAMIWWRVTPSALGTRAPALEAVAFGLAGAGVGFLVSISLGALLEVIGLPVSEQPLLEELLSDPATLIKLAPWIVVAMPVAEEVFFRGYLYRFLSQRISFPTGILASSILFAVVHMNLSGFLVYLGLGMVFALAYRRTSNLLTPVTAHVAYNGMLVLGMFLGL